MKVHPSKAKKQTKNHYNRIASDYYLEHMVAGTAKYYEYSVMSDLLSDLLRHFSSKETVCDLGCGTGLYTELIASKTEFIIATDISIRMLKIASKKNLDFLCLCDAECLPFRSGSMDLVVSFALLEHLPNPEHAIKEVFRVLKTKGRCICMTPNPLFLTLRVRIKQPLDQYETFICPEELKKMFKKILAYRTIYMWPSLRKFSNLLGNISDQLAKCFICMCKDVEQKLLYRIPLIRNMGYLQVVYAAKE